MSKQSRLVSEAISEIKSGTLHLIRQSLADDYNMPSSRRVSDAVRVCTPVAADSTSLGAGSYVDLYDAERERRAYNVRFVDGALLQISYDYSQSGLVRHRLCYLPSPDLLPYLGNSELYVADTPYLEVVGEQVVGVPLRFDYDARDGVSSSVVHPVAHLTMGQHGNCRIPVSAPLSAITFLHFITRSFYIPDTDPESFFALSGMSSMGDTITDGEKRLLHVVVP